MGQLWNAGKKETVRGRETEMQEERKLGVRNP